MALKLFTFRIRHSVGTLNVVFARAAILLISVLEALVLSNLNSSLNLTHKLPSLVTVFNILVVRVAILQTLWAHTVKRKTSCRAQIVILAARAWKIIATQDATLEKSDFFIQNAGNCVDESINVVATLYAVGTFISVVF